MLYSFHLTKKVVARLDIPKECNTEKKILEFISKNINDAEWDTEDIILNEFDRDTICCQEVDE